MWLMVEEDKMVSHRLTQMDTDFRALFQVCSKKGLRKRV